MILESINELIDNGYCMLNHLYVNKGQEGAFEQKFLQCQQHLASVPGFRALRFYAQMNKVSIMSSLRNG